MALAVLATIGLSYVLALFGEPSNAWLWGLLGVRT